MFRFMLAILAFITLFTALMSGADAREPINESRQVSANERIQIINVRGEVRIEAHDSELFEVSGTLDELAESYELTSENGFTRLEVKLPNRQNLRGGNSQGSDLTIRVPRQANVEYEGVTANISAQGIKGSSRLRSVNGTIQAENLSERVQLSSVNGRIESTNNHGRIEIRTVNGAIRDTGSSGRVSYETVNGSVEASSNAEEASLSTVSGNAELKLTEAREINLNSVSGRLDVQLSQNSPRLSAQSVSGNITISFSAGSNARFAVNSNGGGQISNRLTDHEVERATYGPARSLQFSTGSGAGHVDIKSLSGTIRLQ